MITHVIPMIYLTIMIHDNLGIPRYIIIIIDN